jgi:5'-3' exonuclease
MGIPKFFGQWLRRIARSYPGVLMKKVPEYVSSLLIDANFVFHNCAQLNYGYGEYDNEARRNAIKNMDSDILEAEFFMTIENQLLRIINLVKPRENLVISVDGVTPLAKMFQQRSRRIKALETRSEKEIKFDPNCITAGTDFMGRLDKFITKFISKYAFILPPNIFYSSHLVPGEGEIKILNMIRKGRINGNGAHVMYGLDADLIIHSLLSPLKYMYLIRENVDEVLNIEEMKLMLAKIMLSSSTESFEIFEEEEKCKIRDYILDFALIATLVGNDFIPPLYTFQKIDDMYYSVNKMLNAYRMTDLQLVEKDGSINLKNLKVFFENLHDLIKDKESELADNSPDNSPDNFEPKRKVNPKEKSNRSSLCKRYIEGMQWTISYYLSFHVDRFWYYNFNISPTSRDFIECKIDTSINTLSSLLTPQEEYFNVSEYLLIVLPDRNCIPKNLRKYFREFNKILPQTAEVPEEDIREALKKKIALINEKDRIDPQRLVIIRRDPQKQKEYQRIRDFQNRIGVKICMKK